MNTTTSGSHGGLCLRIFHPGVQAHTACLSRSQLRPFCQGAASSLLSLSAFFWIKQVFVFWFIKPTCFQPNPCFTFLVSAPEVQTGNVNLPYGISHQVNASQQLLYAPSYLCYPGSPYSNVIWCQLRLKGNYHQKK